MIIFSKDGKGIINTELIENIFVGSNSIKVNMASGRGCQLGAYQTETEAKVAMQILKERIVRGLPSADMPTDEEVKTRIEMSSKNTNTMTHYDNGQKKKRYGGS